MAKIEEAGRLPGGGRGVLVRGLHRAVLGAAVPGFGEGSSANGLFVQAEPVEDPTGPPTERAQELMKEYRAVVEAILEHRRATPFAEALRGIGDPGALADTAGYSPDLSFEQRIELLETIDVDRPPGQGPGLGQGHARGARAQAADPHRRQRGHGEAPARVHAPPADGRPPQGAGRGRRRRRRRLPGQARRAHHAGSGADRRRAGDRPPRADERAEPRARLDPHAGSTR